MASAVSPFRVSLPYLLTFYCFSRAKIQQFSETPFFFETNFRNYPVISIIIIRIRGTNYGNYVNSFPEDNPPRFLSVCLSMSKSTLSE